MLIRFGNFGMIYFYSSAIILLSNDFPSILILTSLVCKSMNKSIIRTLKPMPLGHVFYSMRRDVST